MRLCNFSDFDTNLVRQIIRFVRPPGISNFTVTLHATKRDPWRGLAQASETVLCENGNTFDRLCKHPLVTIHVPHGAGHAAPFAKPHWYGAPYRGCLYSISFSAEENLVHLLAHELRHLWQARNPRCLWLAIIQRGRKVWGDTHSQFSERDADAYGIHKTRAWRRRGSLSRIENLPRSQPLPVQKQLELFGSANCGGNQ
jgi:hypothetical protein